jgi:hydrogenase expression/formation protein HypE
MNDLIQQMFVHAFDNPFLAARHDSAEFRPNGGRRFAMTTDSFVVRPLFFPGGDIGSLSVYGTVNDLVMSGARPKYLSLGLILEEGFPMESLWRVIHSIRQAALRVGVDIVTGDTKVVENGKGDGVYINTTGVGVIEHALTISPAAVTPGDVVLVSGDLGRHGTAIMAQREGLEFETEILSDCAPLVDSVMGLLDKGITIHCLRDMTRGGLAAAAHEICSASQTSMELEEESIPVLEDVRGACELLGLDAIHVANEGRYLCILPPVDAERAMEILRTDPETEGARIVGRIGSREAFTVSLKTQLGQLRVVDLPSGEQLPRIC